MFGNTAGKNALEKGSSRSVGSITKKAPFNHCSRCNCSPVHKRRMRKAIRKKLMVNRRRVPAQPRGYKRR
jgi:hypothetical protein